VTDDEIQMKMSKERKHERATAEKEGGAVRYKRYNKIMLVGIFVVS